MPSAVQYLDLLDVIGKVPMDGYCSSQHYREWEREVAEPALNDLGYSVISWTNGKADSFGPLSRVATVMKDGEISRLDYG